MKKLISAFLVLLTAAFAAEEKKPSLRSQEVVGVYEAEHAIDTDEHLFLRADGRFTYLYSALTGEVSRGEGRWELRGSQIILRCRGKEDREEDYPLEIRWRESEPVLIYSQESGRSAKQLLLIADSYRRVSTQTPNKAPEPTLPSVTPPAAQEPRRP